MPVELFHMVAGDRIGQGVAREVYVYRPLPEYVIKFELDRAGDFQNVSEWLVWENAPHAARRWLAPCIDISAFGKILIQARVTPWLGKAPKHPKWMDDMHLNNWGTYRGRPVAVDYGRTNVFRRAFR
jgi:hypothetical protein